MDQVLPGVWNGVSNPEVGVDGSLLLSVQDDSVNPSDGVLDFLLFGSL
jgi:hypothetical protein